MFEVAGKKFEIGTHVMGILNANGDSFYAPSRVTHGEIEKAEFMLSNGAEIIDVGGQSTAPNAKRISVLEECANVFPIVENLRREFPSAIISVDTFYAEVARAVLDVGADMINDVSCLADEDMPSVVASYGASLCIMHNRRGSKNPNMWLDKESGLLYATSKALRAGVSQEKIILDGGVGFNLSHDEDKELVAHYDRLDELGYPLLLGTSRKSYMGGQVEERLSATLETTAFAVRKGILFVRVHDVKENKMVIDFGGAYGQNYR